MLHNPAKRADLEAAASEAKQAMVDFEGMTQFEQEVVSRAIFIYGWIRGATKYGKHIATEMPLRADLIAQLGQAGAEYTEEKLGKLEDYLRGLTPFGEKFEKLGVQAISVRNLKSINPVSTAAETVEALLNLSPTADPEQQGTQAMDFVTPSIKMVAEYATGYNFFFGEKYEQRADAFTGPARYPLMKLVKEMVDPTVSAEDISGTPAAQRKNYIPATNSWDARMQALEDYSLGGLADKDLDVEAVQARAKEKLPEDYVAELELDAEEAGLKLSPQALEQAEVFDRLSDDERMKSNAPSKDEAMALAEEFARQNGNQGILRQVEAAENDDVLDRYISLMNGALFGDLRKHENLIKKVLEERDG